MPAEQTINRRLSNWSALTQCPCGRWTHQSSPARSPEGVCWERFDQETGLTVRTWRAIGEGAKRTYDFVGPAHCEGCGWDLTKSPRDNITSMDPREWQQGIVIGTCLSWDGDDVADILPAGVTIEFDGCSLDNVVLGETHTMVPKRNSARGVLCSHNRLHAQADGEDWVCRWKDANGRHAGSPVQPVDKERLQAEGRNVDPDRIAARGV